MQKRSAPALFLAGLAMVAAVAAVTFGVVVALDLDGDGQALDAGPPPTATPAAGAEPATTTTRPLAPDQVSVTGTVTAASVGPAALERLPTPLVITPVEGADGAGAALRDVEVGGRPAEVVWDGGRPLRLHGDGLAVLPQTVDVVAAGGAVTVTFAEGEVVALEPGRYRLVTPVAVGTAGVARPFDDVDLHATVESTLTFRGPATTAVLPRALELSGVGRVHLEGALAVSHPDGTVVEAAAVELTDGAFELSLTPRPDRPGYEVRAVVTGPVQIP